MAIVTPKEKQDADVVITIATAPRKQVWASRIHYFGNGSTVRNAGVLPSSSNAHSGLAIALVSAMKSVSQVRLGKTKLSDARIRIVTEDPTIGRAIPALAAGESFTGLRCSRSLLLPLKRALSRGRITSEVTQGNTTVESLKGWAVNSLTPEIQERVSLRVFTPQRVAESQSV